MKALLNLLANYKAVDALISGSRKVIANDDTKEALLIASSFSKRPGKYVIVKNNLYGAQRLYERLDGLVAPDKCLFFPVDESFRIEALATSPELLTQRVYVLDKLLTEDSYLLVTHTAAITRLLPTVDLFKDNEINLKLNDVIKPEDLVKRLINIGYNRVNKIEHSLQFAKRGGVIDVFSVNNEQPLRIEFFGDEIDSIRLFNLETQRTIETLKAAKIIAATDLIIDDEYYQDILDKLSLDLDRNDDTYDKRANELALLKEHSSYALLYKYYSKVSKKMGYLFDYTEGARVIYSHLNEIRENYNLLMNESFEYLEETKDTSFVLQYDLNHVLDLPKSVGVIELFKSGSNDVVFPLKDVESGSGNAKLVKVLIDDYLHNGYKVVLCVDNPNQIACIKDWMSEWGMSLDYISKDSLPSKPISFTDYAFREGFEITDDKYIYLTPLELFGMKMRSKKAYTRYKDGAVLTSYENLEIGDYVVHENHGVGRFLGIETIESGGFHKDYLHIGYQGSDVLYVPLEQFKLIRKFTSKEGVTPRLNKLGSSVWENTKKKIKKRIVDITQQLFDLYLKRTQKVGHAFQKDEEWQVQFENSFPYELTSDQRRSVEEIKYDMEQPYPMDRLLCGDVGFGKTEVAFIAAFKAMIDGKQVAMLCPTTLLARQHYAVAKERFQNFPINIGILSRMVPNDEQNRYLKGVKDGSINLLIGTHRLLSKDVDFKDLGLLIVDEEQRFGVVQKERIKELKEGIDVLSLSATPIPRTLQTTLLGIRSLSQIDTPPLNRMPIQTYVLEKNPRLLKEIMERELSRGGQVFYLHNRIEDIYRLAKQINESIPGSKVVVVHGKMTKESIEDAMLDFNDGKANIMICTTIIENGIDIPNANTIIVENADRFGLAQLYQIKGRVGRGDRLAYAYLCYDGSKALSEVASKRLHAIKEFVELGSGYRIALRDLSIRGAGDILGAEQAGFIDTVGMDMYLHLLQEAIDEQKYGPKEETASTQPYYKVDAYIPSKFTAGDLDKIDLYKKIADVTTLKALIDLEQEMTDIYGKLPDSVKLLLNKRRFEIFTESELVEEVKDAYQFYELVLSEQVSSYDGIGIDVFRILSNLSSSIKVTYKDKRIRVRLPKNDPKWLEYANYFFKELAEVVREYQKKVSI